MVFSCPWPQLLPPVSLLILCLLPRRCRQRRKRARRGQTTTHLPPATPAATVAGVQEVAMSAPWLPFLLPLMYLSGLMQISLKMSMTLTLPVSLRMLVSPTLSVSLRIPVLPILSRPLFLLFQLRMPFVSSRCCCHDASRRPGWVADAFSLLLPSRCLISSCLLLRT